MEFRKSELFLSRNGRDMTTDDGCLTDAMKKWKRGVATALLLRDYKLCANYETMFSDTRPRNQFKKKTFAHKLPHPVQQKTNLKSTEDMKQLMEVQGSHRTLFYRQPSRKHVSSYSTIFVNLNESEKKVSFEDESEAEEKVKRERSSMVITLPVKSEKLATKGTQTDYRESEAQTQPWKHEIKAQGKILAELLTLDWFSPDKNYPPGVEEVTLIEKARQKLAWENVIKGLKGKENELKRKSLAQRVAINEAALRESKKDKEDHERIEISRRQMKEAMETFEDKLWLRLQKSYGCRRRENDSKIDYWNHQLTRKIRKMKSARGPLVAKSGIIEMHKDRASELWAPKLRHGENPSLGHEVIDIQCRYLKRFHGLEILEKHISDILYPDFSKPSYESLISKPKELGLCPKTFREKVVEKPKEEQMESLSLKIPVPPPTPEPPIPRVSSLRSDSEENLYQASLLLGKLIKGRSIQAQKFAEFFKMAT